MPGRHTRNSQQTIQDLIAGKSFCSISKDVLSLLITEKCKYFDMVVDLQGQTLDTFSNLTQKTTQKTRIY